jgi:hypothetical protein
VPGGEVEQLLHGLWLIAAELMHQGPAICAGPKCREDVGVTDLGELMEIVEKSQNVIPEGLTLLLSATLQIPGVARLYVHALKVVSDDLPEILSAINRVPRQVVEPSLGRVGQVNGEKLDNEEVIVRPSCPACKAVILQSHSRVGFAIILDDVV